MDEVPPDVRARLACAAEWGRQGRGWLAEPLPALNDPEGERVPAGLFVVDAHVHLFPDRVFDAMWGWFEEHGWPVRYRLRAPDVLDFLRERGVARVVALHYAHRPGIARDLNAFVARTVHGRDDATALATVFPGEPEQVAILEEAFAMGLAGVKLHCHVQCMRPDDPALEPVWELCADRGRPVVIHAGREPKSPAYACDPHEVCAADRVGRVLSRWPRLKLVVPHLGADEFAAYAELLRRHDNLWLDTTMAMAGYFPVDPPAEILSIRPDRVLYGSDFPNLPYAWDRELRRIPHDPALLAGNALALFRR